MATHGVAFVHAGTHKTGTSSLQAMLARNDTILRSAGVYVPRCGRTDQRSAGHHNIAWELSGNPQFDPTYGTFAHLLAEIAACTVSTVCLSSEEFEFLSTDVRALTRLRDGFASIGYEVRIILYLRSQADYLESLYAEIVKAWDVPFADFFETILATGSYSFSWAAYDEHFRSFGGVNDTNHTMCSQFAYDRLTAGFADVFGEQAMIVRAYRPSGSAGKLLHEFLEIIAPGRVAYRRIRQPERMNRSFGFCKVVAARANRVGCEPGCRVPVRQRFDPLSLLDLIRIMVRFARGNERVAKRFGVHVGTTTWGTLAREVLTTLLHDRDSCYRKALIRALDRADATVDVAA